MNLSRTSLAIILVTGVLLLVTLNRPSMTYSQNDYEDKVIDLEWSADGSYLAVGFESGILEIRNGASGNIIFTYEPEYGLKDFGWSPDNQRLAIVNRGLEYEGYISIFNVSTESIESTANIYASVFGDVVWSPDGTQIAVISAEQLTDWGLQGITVFDVTPQGLELSLFFDADFGSIDWRPDSPQIAATSYWSGYVVIMDVSTGGSVKHIQDDQSLMLEVAYSPDGAKLAAMDHNRTLSIYDAESYTLLKEIETPIGGFIAWSPDSNSIAVGGGFQTGGQLLIYDIDTEQPILTMATGSLMQMAWNPDGSQIAFGGIDTFEFTDTTCLIPPGDGSVPVMISPCATEDDTLWPTYSWWAADDADWYHIYVDDVPTRLIRPFGTYGLWVEASEVCNGDICEFRPVDGLANTSPNHFGLANSTYQWTIRSLDSSTGLASDWQPLQVFEVVNPVPTLITPTQQTGYVTGFPTYTWTPVPDADWYQVWVGSQSGTQLINIWLNAADVCDEQACRYQSLDEGDYLRANQYNGLYTWSVRAYNSRANVYGLWQTTSNIAVATSTPAAPSFASTTPILNMPARQSLTLTWPHNMDEEFYQIWVGNAAHQPLLPPQQTWVYHQAVCVDDVCSLTFYFDGVAVEAYLGTYKATGVPVWSAVYPLTVIEPSGEMADVLPPTGSPSTEDGLDAEPTPTDGFVPPSDSEPPVEIPLYPDICTDNPLCDSPFGDE